MAAASGVCWALAMPTVRGTRLNRASPGKSLFFQLAFCAPLLAGACLLSGQWLCISWSLQLGGLVLLNEPLVAHLILALATVTAGLLLGNQREPAVKPP